MNAARNEAIIERAVMGWHEADIAADMGLSLGVVHGVLTRWRAAPRRLLVKPAKINAKTIARVMERIGLAT